MRNNNNFELFVGGTYNFGLEKHLPTIGIDYEHFLTHTVAIGVLTDLELNDQLPGNALLITPTIFYLPFKENKLFIGSGIEINEEEALFLFRAGYGVEFHLYEQIHVSPTVSLDITKEYLSIVYGVAVGFCLFRE